MGALPRPKAVDREQVYHDLTADGEPTPTRQWLAKILASWMAGQGVLPDRLGLEPDQFDCLLETLFPHAAVPAQAASCIRPDFDRMLEKDDLIKLLSDYRRDDGPETGWIAGLIVSACLGSDHLWQDLGLWQRSELSALMAYHFPELATRNVKDMKWKKFLYKQLCEAEGLYLCRAPSCEVCADYKNCFGPED